MGIFFTAPQQVAPAIQTALHSALAQDPKTLAAPLQTEAAARAQALIQTTAPQFNLRNFILAVIISGVLLALAIWTDKTHNSISTTLMTSFTSFSGIVLGLLGGEAQKSTS
jgi:hypothetical protein